MNISQRPFEKILSSIILKVSNICNFSCPYCFMFSSNDMSFKSRPNFMESEIIEKTTKRIQEYVTDYNIDELDIILHGGEPLLLGAERLKYIFKQLSSIKKCHINISIQTNGSLISSTITTLCKKYNVVIGVSLDGYPAVQNKTKTKSGKNSYPLILSGIRVLQEQLGDKYFRGLLSVIDLNADPYEVYKHFLDLKINKMDFLLPLRNHKYKFKYNPENLLYFKWLKVIFDKYFDDDNPDIEIRIFDSIIDILLGAKIPMCSIRHSALDILVIETNGNIELVDDLRICGEDFTNLELNVQYNKISDFFEHSRINELYLAEKQLPVKCKECTYFQVCGSGGHAFRYGSDDTYNHSSYYCQDTYALIDYINNKISQHL